MQSSCKSMGRRAQCYLQGVAAVELGHRDFSAQLRRNDAAGSVGSAFSIGSVGSLFSIGSCFGLGTALAVLSVLSFGGYARRVAASKAPSVL